MSRTIVPLYPPDGGPLLGFCCRFIIHGEGPQFPHECRELFKTEEGAWRHASTAHGILRQPKLEGPDDTIAKARGVEP